MTYTPPRETSRKATGKTFIQLVGCDDTTKIPAEDFTIEELAAYRKLARISVELGGGCMPTMSLGSEYLVTVARDDATGYTYLDVVDEDE